MSTVSDPTDTGAFQLTVAPRTEPATGVHASSRQLFGHPSKSSRLPSSHGSPTSTSWLPQRSVVQDALQPSPPTRLPSSHVSGAVTTELPQITQARVHPSSSRSFMSSHSSPGSTTPLPQTDGPGSVVVVVDVVVVVVDGAEVEVVVVVWTVVEVVVDEGRVVVVVAIVVVVVTVVVVVVVVTPGSSAATTSATKASTADSTAPVSPDVRQPPFASSFAKHPFSGFAPPSNFALALSRHSFAFGSIPFASDFS